jgi:uncharacterized protein YaiL (DUF2058 family)
MNKVLQDLLTESTKLEEARTKTAFDLWAAGVAAANRAKKKEIADRERAEREAIKKQQRELAALDRAARAKPPKLTQDQIWNKVETAISNSFPDGDPIDHLMGWMEKNNVTMGQIDAAVKKYARVKGMYAYLEQMWDSMQADTVHDAEMALKNNKQFDDNSVFYYFDGEKIIKNSNPWK